MKTATYILISAHCPLCSCITIKIIKQLSSQNVSEIISSSRPGTAISRTRTIHIGQKICESG